MTPEAHIAKAARLMRTMDRCRNDDYEMVIEGAMLAGNHYVNATLHKLGIRAQHADIIHTDYMSVAQFRRLGILAPDVLDCLEAIEAFRAPFVRGNAPGGASAASEARILLAKLVDAFHHMKPNTLPIVDYMPAEAAVKK
jgi:hypothetical protein